MAKKKIIEVLRQQKVISRWKQSEKDALGISLLEKGGPEFIFVFGVEEGEPAVISGKPVVHHHVHPPAVLPEPAAKQRRGSFAFVGPARRL